MILLSAIAWAAALWAVFMLVPFPRNRALRLLAIASIWLLPSYREWTFGFGAVMSESLSSAAFLAAVVMLFRGIFEPRLGWFAASGVSFGIATAFRTYFLYVADAMILWTGIAILAAWIVLRIRRRISLRGMWRERWIAGFAIAFLAFVAVLEPWRIYKWSRIKTSALVAIHDKYAYYHSWEPADQIPAFHKAGDAACQVDPKLCKVVWANMSALRDEDVRNLVFMTVAAHPFAYAWVKLRLINWLWFGREWSYIFLEKPWMAAEGLILFGLGVLGIVRLGRALERTRAPEYAIAALVIALFVAVNVAVFGLYTYEWRYSQGMRTLAFFLPLLAFKVSSTSTPDRP
jgi:hypothetical protein